jgi:hypothetical protein
MIDEAKIKKETFIKRIEHIDRLSYLIITIVYEYLYYFFLLIKILFNDDSIC